MGAIREGSAPSSRTADVRELYSALLHGGELSGTDALAASQQMLQILMDSMTNAVFWKDVDSCYLGCNRVFASFAGCEPALLIGKSDRDMPWADDAEFDSEWFMDWDRAVVESGEPRFGILERLQRADGEVRWLETNKVPLRDVNGEIIGVLGTFEDVTGRRNAEEELQRTLDDLDDRVQRRTTELVRANEALRREVEDRIRLQAEERQQRAYAEALRDTAAAMSETLDVDDVIEQVLFGVERLVSNDLAALIVTRPDGSLELAREITAYGYVPAPIDASAIDVGSLTVVGRLRAESGPVIVDDPAAAIGPARCVLGSRMQVADQVVGYLLLESATAEFFTDAHADRLRAVAGQAGSALSNAQLAGRASELAAAEERQRLARDLHDAVNQTLWTAALTAESTLAAIDDGSELHHRLSRLRQLTRGALSEMRSLLLELRPAELADVSLDELIRHLLTALECRRTLAVADDLDPVQLEPSTHVAVYRIAQEALGNVAQHSDASSLLVRLRDGPQVELVIEDDGVGFDPQRVGAGHFGLGNMRDRAASIDAELQIVSAPGAGASVRVRVGR
jgi:PAS domain S-box-containing protein